MSYGVPGVAEFVVGQLVQAVEDVRESIRGGATFYAHEWEPAVPAVWVTEDWVIATSTPQVTVRAWVGLKEVVRLDIRTGTDYVRTQFGHGKWENHPYAEGLEPLVASWRDQVSASLQTRTEGEVS
jgi:hypothetical protein